MNKLNISFEKLKSSFGKKGKTTALFIILGFIGIFLIFISEFNFDSEAEEKTTVKGENFSSEKYCDYLESKVQEIVESIDGAGKASVMITLSETTEYIYATDGKEVRKNTDNSNDVNSENSYVIISKDKNDAGLLLKTIEPKVRGVAIVCEGGENVKVQEQIYSAIGAVLNVSTSRISISKLTVTDEKKDKSIIF